MKYEVIGLKTNILWKTISILALDIQITDMLKVINDFREIKRRIVKYKIQIVNNAILKNSMFTYWRIIISL